MLIFLSLFEASLNSIFFKIFELILIKSSSLNFAVDLAKSEISNNSINFETSVSKVRLLLVPIVER